MSSVQITCPACNGAQPRGDSGDYECMFCLSPFSVAQAESEESRLAQEIKSWIESTAGAAALAPGGVDATSRSFIFQEKMLPGLKRDVDRSLERLGSFAQFPLVSSLVPVPASGRGSNPLVDRREDVLGLKLHQARLMSPGVATFALTDADKAAVTGMERRISDFIHLSNVAEAGAKRSAAGYMGARRNLQTLISMLDEELGTEMPAGRLAFLGMLKERYQCLSEYSEIAEQLASPNAVSGAGVLERMTRIAASLNTIARSLEEVDHNPGETMPMVIGVDGEKQSCLYLARWLVAYDALTHSQPMAFGRFVTTIRDLYGDKSAAQMADLMEGCAQVVGVARGASTTLAINEFDWLDDWAEGQRKKKTFGLFGVEERRGQTDAFLVPFWVADVSYSRADGAVFVDGKEDTGVLLVQACKPSAESVVFITDPGNDIVSSLDQLRAIGGESIAMPMSTAETAAQVMSQSVSRKPGVKNPRVKMRGLAYIAAAVVDFDSSQGSRKAAVCLAGRLPVDPSIREHVGLAQQVLSAFQ
jgi:hypothetical protein